MKRILILLFIPFAGNSQPENFNQIYSQYDLMPAAKIVVDAFKSKNIIFIGEPHFIKEHVNFIASLIEPLHRNGINMLFTEFARYGDSDLINSLITGESFDSAMAQKITHKVTGIGGLMNT